MMYLTRKLPDPRGVTDPRWQVYAEGANGQRLIAGMWTNEMDAERHAGVLNNLVRGAPVGGDTLHSAVHSLVMHQNELERVQAAPEVHGTEGETTMLNRLRGAVDMAHAIGLTSPRMLQYAFARWGDAIGRIAGRALGYLPEQIEEWSADFADLSKAAR